MFCESRELGTLQRGTALENSQPLLSLCAAKILEALSVCA